MVVHVMFKNNLVLRYDVDITVDTGFFVTFGE